MNYILSYDREEKRRHESRLRLKLPQSFRDHRVIAAKHERRNYSARDCFMSKKRTARLLCDDDFSSRRTSSATMEQVL
ncbi:hypothetical protein KIN20_028846 [Parelaphostrongylus tenuis]|uniref:Uncharacterized protein n=1 Tax=Parelaphostrongylus tenuis TaxID=148309 RepID=A0AAD5R1D6_PARTN|nr:hypothetical protein KIN20_028846 [Parelaphostrongylus tenuis]